MPTMRRNRPTPLHRALPTMALLTLAACGNKETVSIRSEYGTQYKVEKATTSIMPYAIETLRAFTDRREKELCLKHFDDNFCSYQYSRMLGIAEEQALKESMAFAKRIEAEKTSSRSPTRSIPIRKTPHRANQPSKALIASIRNSRFAPSPRSRNTSASNHRA
jgi:hypothetical protein